MGLHACSLQSPMSHWSRSCDCILLWGSLEGGSELRSSDQSPGVLGPRYEFIRPGFGKCKS